jgi:hypothetical protein
VILRVIRGRGEAEQLDALRRALSERPGSGAPDVAGPIRVHLGCRPSKSRMDVLVISFWPSAEAAAQGDKWKTSPLAIAQRHLDGCEAEHFEVDDTLLRRSDDEPVAIRVATGRFSRPGADIEMLELLRQRMPLVGDDMCEAYVGRRIVDRAVEVTFVSAWRRLPPDRRLEDTFWQDIALRYDEFDVEVYLAIPCT